MGDGQLWHVKCSTTVAYCKHFRKPSLLAREIIFTGGKCCGGGERIKKPDGRLLAVVVPGHSVADAWLSEDVGGIGSVVSQFTAEGFDCGSKRPQV